MHAGLFARGSGHDCIFLTRKKCGGGNEKIFVYVWIYTSCVARCNPGDSTGIVLPDRMQMDRP